MSTPTTLDLIAKVDEAFALPGSHGPLATARRAFDDLKAALAARSSDTAGAPTEPLEQLRATLRGIHRWDADNAPRIAEYERAISALAGAPAAAVAPDVAKDVEYVCGALAIFRTGESDNVKAIAAECIRIVKTLGARASDAPAIQDAPADFHERCDDDRVSRKSDYDPTAGITLTRTDSGDVGIMVTGESLTFAGVGGGGHSRQTWRALLNLFDAMRADFRADDAPPCASAVADRPELGMENFPGGAD